MAAYDGTQIAADGKRYDIGDEDAPTTAPTAAGKLITHGQYETLEAPLWATALSRWVAIMTADLGDLDALLQRTVTDAVVTNADATVTSAAANFTAADVGARATNAKFPEGTTIASINSESSVEMSAVATSAGTGQTLVIRRDVGEIIATLESA